MDTLIVKYILEQGIGIRNTNPSLTTINMQEEIDKVLDVLKTAKTLVLHNFSTKGNQLIYRRLLGRKVTYIVAGNLNIPKLNAIRVLLVENIIVSYEYC